VEVLELEKGKEAAARNYAQLERVRGIIARSTCRIEATIRRMRA
jgi:hypothetical protein